MISLIYTSYRPGGIDLLSQSFWESHLKLDYELIVVDDLPGRVERGTAKQFLIDKGINVGWYGGSKHRSYNNILCGRNNALNTGLMHSRGDFIVFMNDFMFLSPSWLPDWYKVIEIIEERRRGKLIAGCSAIVYKADKPTEVTDVNTWLKGAPIAPKKPYVPRSFAPFYWGASAKFFEDINGFDERADHSIDWIIPSILHQAVGLGYELLIEPLLCCHLIEHTAWDVKAVEPGPYGNLPGYSLWKIAKNIMTQVPGLSPGELPKWEIPSPNPFNLKEIRRKYIQNYSSTTALEN